MYSLHFVFQEKSSKRGLKDAPPSPLATPKTTIPFKRNPLKEDWKTVEYTVEEGEGVRAFKRNPLKEDWKVLFPASANTLRASFFQEKSSKRGLKVHMYAGEIGRTARSFKRNPLKEDWKASISATYSWNVLSFQEKSSKRGLKGYNCLHSPRDGRRTLSREIL